MYALQLQGVSKIYGNRISALQSINLTVKKGDFFALLGPNGAGKSTLIGIITSLVKKSSGAVQLFDYDLDRAPLQAKQLVGLIPQEFNFNPFETVLQITLNQAGFYGIRPKQALSRIEYYLQKLNLWDKRHQPARTLSGGMKRRLMIVRALVHNPQLLILDEPTAGVDIELRYLLWDFLKTLNMQGMTLILTTHYLEEAEKLCHHLGILHQGRLIEQGSMQQLLGKCNTETVRLQISPTASPPFQLSHYSHRWLNATTLEVEVQCQQGLNDLIQQLDNHQYRVLHIENQSNRLEKLLLSLVKDTAQENHHV